MTRPHGLDSLKQPETLAAQAFEAIRDAILRRAFRPGDELTERGVARQLGVSPTPVREALQRLEQVGLVERTAGRSHRVSALLDTPPDELLRIEASLRGVASALAATKISADEKRGLQQIVEQEARASSPHEALERARQTHNAIHRASRNPLLMQFLNTTYYLRRHLMVNLPVDELTEDQVHIRREQHAAIAKAVIDGDATEAERLAIEHALFGGLRAQP